MKQIITFKDLGIVEDSFAAISPQCFSENIRALRQNNRQGTVKVKGRSEVSFSGKKPWKQKGTGRARAGDRCSPLWRKGGVIFGPQPRVRGLQVMQSVRRGVLRTLFREAVQAERVIALEYDATVLTAPKTAYFFDLLKKAGLHTARRIAFFTTIDDFVVNASVANISSVALYLFDQPNAYVCARADYWVYLKKDAEHFRTMVQAWI